MPYGPMIYPGPLATLGRSGHSGGILTTDGNYPVASDAPAMAERVLLNFTPGPLDVTRVLEVLRHTVPIERVGLMAPATDTVGIEAPEAIPAHDGYRAALPNVAFGEIPHWDFYDAAKIKDITVVAVSADQRFCTNLPLTIGVYAPGE